MRNARINKQNMYYALLDKIEPDYKLDSNGNKIVDYVDSLGVNHYREKSNKKLTYKTPVKFQASISMSGSDAEVTPFGISENEYDATIVVPKGVLPITETSLIWYKSEIVYKDADETIPDSSSADYTVTKVTPSLNFMRYELKAVVK